MVEELRHFAKHKFSYGRNDASGTFQRKEEWVTRAILSLRNFGEIPLECTDNQDYTKLQAILTLWRKSLKFGSKYFKNMITLEIEAQEPGRLITLAPNRVPVPQRAGTKALLKVIYVHATETKEGELDMTYYKNENVIFSAKHGRLYAEGRLVVPIKDTVSLMVLMCLNPLNGMCQRPKRLFCSMENFKQREHPEWKSYKSDDTNFV